MLFRLLSGEVSQRESARILAVNDKTVARRLDYFKEVAMHLHGEFLNMLKAEGRLSSTIQFDDMETFEHTKLKPVAIPLLVDGKERFIYGIDAASMPAKGLLAAISVKKYGKRDDDRAEAWLNVLSMSKPFIATEGVTITTDMHTLYPKMIKRVLPGVEHIRKKSRRAAVVGQGELKKGGHDPLFSLNHTAAMLRAHICRLIRRSWNTTKKIDRLVCHLWLYVLQHNVSIEMKRRQRLLRERAIPTKSKKNQKMLTA